MLNRKILIEAQYFPNIQFCSKWFLYPTMEIEQHEHYSKGSYRNRCHIVTANGIQRLTIPLEKGKNEQMSIRDVRISTHTKWQNHHFKSIQTAYRSAPFYEYYIDTIQPFFDKKYDFLFDLNVEIIETLMHIIPNESQLTLNTAYLKSTEVNGAINDFRNKISPKAHKNIPDPTFKNIAYHQVFNEKQGFVENLSILDMIFNLGPETSLRLEESINMTFQK